MTISIYFYSNALFFTEAYGGIKNKERYDENQFQLNRIKVAPSEKISNHFALKVVCDLNWICTEEHFVKCLEA